MIDRGHYDQYFNNIGCSKLRSFLPPKLMVTELVKERRVREADS